MPDPSFYARLGRLSGIVTILPSTMGAGFLLGYYLIDRNFGTFPLGSVVLALIGAGIGFYEILQLLSPAGRKKP